MKIRSHLIILILATLLPVVLFAAVMTERLWEEQRASYEQTFLERVRALRVALDTELAATQRSLRALSDTGGDGTDDPERFRARLLRKLQAEPAWAGVAIVASRGEPWLEVHREGEPAMPRVDAATVAAVFKTREPAVSDLIAASEGARYYTFVAVPMARNGAIDRVMYVGIEHGAWLDFLQSYPIAENATLDAQRPQWRDHRAHAQRRALGRQAVLASVPRTRTRQGRGRTSQRRARGPALLFGLQPGRKFRWTLGTAACRSSMSRGR